MLPTALERLEQRHAEREAERGPGSVLEAIRWAERRWRAAGFPPLSEWWSDTLYDFYATRARTLVLRVGRQGGKSSTLCRIGVLEACFGQHQIPMGTRAMVAIVSVRRKDAVARLYTIKKLLKAIGEPFLPLGDSVDLVKRPVSLSVYTASIAGVSGPTCICAICDEVAKWRDMRTGANPAREVLASLRPTMVTQPNARMFLSSSPLGELDAHAAAFRDGNTDEQRIAYAPSWVANPSVTIESTKRDAKSTEIWSREYEAKPLEQADEGLLTSAELDDVTAPGAEPLPGHWYVAAMDAATRGDRWTFAIATERDDGVRHVVYCRQWQPMPDRPLDPELVLHEIAIVAKEYSVPMIWCDDYGGEFVSRMARSHGLQLAQETWSGPRRLEVFEALAARVRARRISIPPDRDMRADLLSVRRILTRNGLSISFGPSTARGHSDYAPVVAHLVAAPCQTARPPIAVQDREAREELRREVMREREMSGRKPCPVCRGAGCPKCAELGHVRAKRKIIGYAPPR